MRRSLWRIVVGLLACLTVIPVVAAPSAGQEPVEDVPVEERPDPDDGKSDDDEVIPPRHGEVLPGWELGMPGLEAPELSFREAGRWAEPAVRRGQVSVGGDEEAAVDHVVPAPGLEVREDRLPEWAATRSSGRVGGESPGSVRAGQVVVRGKDPAEGGGERSRSLPVTVEVAGRDVGRAGSSVGLVFEVGSEETLSKEDRFEIEIDVSGVVESMGPELASALVLVRGSDCDERRQCRSWETVTDAAVDLETETLAAVVSGRGAVEAEEQKPGDGRLRGGSSEGVAAPAASDVEPGETLGSAVSGGPAGGVGTLDPDPDYDIYSVQIGGQVANTNYSAAPLAQLSSHQVGLSTGNFEYTVPFVVPPAEFGQAPSLGLAYSSGSLNGMISSENTQAGDAGLGWSLTGLGSVVQHMVPCGTDNTGWTDSGCPSGEYSLQFGDVGGRLVRKGFMSQFVDGGVTWNREQFYVESDPTLQVVRHTAPAARSSNPVAIAGTSDNKGYWEMNRNGDLYAFGSAAGIVGDTDGKTNWADLDGHSTTGLAMITDDGYAVTRHLTIFAQATDPIASLEEDSAIAVGIEINESGDGAWVLGSNGGVYTYGSNIDFHGSLATPNNVTAVDIESIGDDHYAVLWSDGSVRIWGTYVGPNPWNWATLAEWPGTNAPVGTPIAVQPVKSGANWGAFVFYSDGYVRPLGAANPATTETAEGWISENDLAHDAAFAGNGAWFQTSSKVVPSRLAPGLASTNPDRDMTWWEVTAPDGTRSRFGYGATKYGKSATYSVRSVPTDPGAVGSCGPNDLCEVAYQWDLEEIETTDGMTISYFWSQQRQYNKVDGHDRSYTASSLPYRILYGNKLDDPYPGVRVYFGTSTRDSSLVEPTVCGFDPNDGGCDKGVRFFSTRQLSAVHTYVLDNNCCTHHPVESYFLNYHPTSYTSGAGSSHRLLLASVERTTTGVDTAPASFEYELKENRALHGGTGGFMRMHRISEVTNELGGRIKVTYELTDATEREISSHPCSKLRTDDHDDTAHIEGCASFIAFIPNQNKVIEPALFNLWTVSKIESIDVTQEVSAGTGSKPVPDGVVTYEYVNPRFGFTDKPGGTIPLGDTDGDGIGEGVCEQWTGICDSWSDFRGHESVVVTTTVDSQRKAIEEHRFFTGLYRDREAGNSDDKTTWDYIPAAGDKPCMIVTSTVCPTDYAQLAGRTMQILYRREAPAATAPYAIETTTWQVVEYPDFDITRWNANGTVVLSTAGDGVKAHPDLHMVRSRTSRVYVPGYPLSTPLPSSTPVLNIPSISSSSTKMLTETKTRFGTTIGQKELGQPLRVHFIGDAIGGSDNTMTYYTYTHPTSTDLWRIGFVGETRTYAGYGDHNNGIEVNWGDGTATNVNNSNAVDDPDLPAWQYLVAMTKTEYDKYGHGGVYQAGARVSTGRVTGTLTLTERGSSEYSSDYLEMEYQFNSVGRLLKTIQVTTPGIDSYNQGANPGNATSYVYSYDSAERLWVTKTVDPNGAVSWKWRDQATDAVRYTADANTTSTSTAPSLVIEKTPAVFVSNPDLTRIEIDGFGRPTRVTLPGDSFESYEYEYDHDGQGFNKITTRTRVGANLGTTDSYTFFGGFGHTLQSQSRTYNHQSNKRDVTYYLYNNRGDLRFVSEPVQRNGEAGADMIVGASQDWSVFGYTSHIIDPDGHTASTTTVGPGHYAGPQTWAYNHGNYQIAKDARGSYTTSRIDNLGNTRWTRNRAGTVTTSDYDELGRIIKVDAPDRSGATNATNITTVDYDEAGRKISLTTPDAGTWTYTYGTVGRVDTQTDAKGQTLQFNYDPAGRLTQIFEGSDIYASYGYHPPNTGHPNDEFYPHPATAGSNIDNEPTSISYRYDRAGRLTRTSYDTVPGLDVSSLAGGAAWTENTYHTGGLPNTTRLVTGEKLTYLYSANGSLSQIRSDRGTPATTGDDINYATATARDAHGRVTAFSRAGEIDETFGYNPNHHRLQFHTATVTGGAQLLGRVLEYDDNGNMWSLIDNRNNGEIVCYQHNNRDFLSAAWTATQAPPGANNCTQAESQRGQGPGDANFAARWTYDDAGNILSAGGPGTASPTSTNGNRASYGYTGTGPHAVTRLWQQTPGASDPVLWKFTYDANGNQTQRTDETTSTTHHLGYDARNRLVEIGTTPGADNILDSVYNGNGTRLVRRSGGDTVYYLGNVEIHDKADGTRIERTTYSFEGRTIASRDVTTPPTGGPTPVTLGYIVTDPNNLTSAEQTIRDELLNNGYGTNDPNSLVYIDDDTVDNSGNLPTGIDAVLVSSNVITNKVNSVIGATALPVMVLKRFLFIDLGLATNQVTASGQTQIDITTNSHPITAGLPTGTITVLNNSGGLGAGTGLAGGVLGTVVGDTNRGTIIALDQGDPLAGGGHALSRRVGFFAINALPNKLSTTGWTLFHQALDWTIEPAQGTGGGTPTDELHWIITDHLGTPAVTTNQTGGNVIKSLRYPFGTERHSTGAPITDINFTGQTSDPNTGLIDYNARHYDPLVSRFAMADPIIIDGTNRYSYVRNGPTNAIDPTGLCTRQMILNGCGGERGEDLPDSQRTCLESGRGCPASLDDQGSKQRYPPSSSSTNSRSVVDNLTVSRAGIEMIFFFEGVRSTAYEDSEGFCTVGVGYLIRRGPCTAEDLSRYSNLSETEVIELFRESLANEVGRLPEAISAQLTQYEYDALASLAFNVGRNAIPGSMLAAEINKGHEFWDPDVIRLQWDWGRSMCDSSPGICVRRDAEAELFLTGVYPSP